MGQQCWVNSVWQGVQLAKIQIGDDNWRIALINNKKEKEGLVQVGIQLG